MVIRKTDKRNIALIHLGQNPIHWFNNIKSIGGASLLFSVYVLFVVSVYIFARWRINLSINKSTKKLYEWCCWACFFVTFQRRNSVE